MLMGFTLLLSDFFIDSSSFLGGLPARPDVLNGRRGESCEMDFARRGGPACPPIFPGAHAGAPLRAAGQDKKKSPIPLGWNSLYHQKYPNLQTYEQPPGRSSGSRISRRRSAFPPGFFIDPRQWPACALTFSVPDYSGGTAPDSHRVPDCLGFG